VKRWGPKTCAGRWPQSVQFRALSRDAIRRWNAERVRRPRCGAKRKNGSLCQQWPMPNGRCHWHGGRTGRGASWHQPIFSSNPAKLERKLRDLKRREKRRGARLAAATPAERERHAAWQLSHSPGAAAARKAKREARRQGQEARKLLAKPRPAGPHDAEIAQLGEQIDALKRRAAEIEAETTDLAGGVFE
jgi:hypothetical protein